MDRAIADDALRDTIVGAAKAFGAVVAGEPVARTGAVASATRPWLTKVRATIHFRTARSTTFAGLQLAREGHPVVVGQRSLIVEAPWLLLSALVAKVGPGTDVRGVELEAARPASRSQGRLALGRRGSR